MNRQTFLKTLPSFAVGNFNNVFGPILWSALFTTRITHVFWCLNTDTVLRLERRKRTWKTVSKTGDCHEDVIVQTNNYWARILTLDENRQNDSSHSGTLLINLWRTNMNKECLRVLILIFKTWLVFSIDKCLTFFKHLQEKLIFTCNSVLLKQDLFAHVLSACLYIEEEKK